MSVLEISNLSYTYAEEGKQVLQDINFVFKKGRFYSIVGSSGAGKSTLLSLLAGLDIPTHGHIMVNDEDIQETGYSEHRKDQISLVFQSYNLIDYLTPLENLRLVNPEADEKILQEFGLTDGEIHRNVMKLSGGQQQRVAIARAIVSDAPIILADEPTGNLDENTAAEIISMLQDMAHKEQKCVIVVTHSKQLAQASDEILQLKDKKLKRK